MAILIDDSDSCASFLAWGIFSTQKTLVVLCEKKISNEVNREHSFISAQTTLFSRIPQKKTILLYKTWYIHTQSWERL